jgi:branched-chain amino acid transport system ATP-binding protein
MSAIEAPDGESEPAGTLLSVRDVVVRYGEATAVAGVSFDTDARKVTAILGANGAGKSSLASAIVGSVRPASGSVRIGGEETAGRPAHRIARLGVASVPEGRGIFPHLSVGDNLRAQFRHAVPREERAAALDRAFAHFPVLAERRRQAAGTLSGGEQQMLALARVLAAPPRLLVADEMSLGLAPRMVDLVFESLAQAVAEGVAIVLVEQYVERALALADEAVIMQRGRVAWQGPASEAGAHATEHYLGSGSEDA